MLERMGQEHGKTLAHQRFSEIEAVFGQLKHNDQFRGVTMRGGEVMIDVEVGLQAIAQNLRKMQKRLYRRYYQMILALSIGEPQHLPT